jgi:hypothetical protein
LAAEFTVLNVSKPAHTTGLRPFMPKIVSDLAENLYRASRRCVHAVTEFGNERTIVAVATYTFGDHAVGRKRWKGSSSEIPSSCTETSSILIDVVERQPW